MVLSGDSQLFQIIGVTLRMSLTSSLAALLIGVPPGILVSMYNFKGKNALIVLNRTLMGLPPVVCGLLCYMLFSGNGPLGYMKLLFTVKAMIIAQVILITPQIIGNTESYMRLICDDIRATALGLSLPKGKILLLALNESKYQIISTYLFGFSRGIAEVGAVSMVGGAIAFKTNVMTTAIMNYTNRGDFTMGVALGMILLAMSLILNCSVYLIQGKVNK